MSHLSRLLKIACKDSGSATPPAGLVVTVV